MLQYTRLIKSAGSSFGRERWYNAVRHTLADERYLNLLLSTF